MKKILSLILAVVLLLGSAVIAAPSSNSKELAPIAKAANENPAKVTGVKVIPGYDSAIIKWSKVSGATEYRIYKCSGSKNNYECVKTVSSTSVKLSGLKVNKTYKVKVCAVKVSGDSKSMGKKSDAVKFTTAYKPVKVTGLKAGKIKATSVMLSWSIVPNVTTYKVYKYDSSSKKYTLVAKSSSAKCTVKGLKEKTSYKFAVRACLTVGGKEYSGDYSSLCSVKTKSSSKSLTPDSKDLKNLRSMMESFSVAGYDSSAPDALKKADSIMFPAIYGLWSTMYDIFGWGNYSNDYNGKFYSCYGDHKSKDPLRYLVNSYAEGYYKLSASKVDFIYKNVLGVTPSHKPIRPYDDDSVTAYYYKGYYYVGVFAVGDIGAEYKIKSCKKQDGKYVIKLKEGYTDYESNFTKTGDVTCTAKLVNIDGKRFWRIYKVNIKRPNNW